MYFQKNTIERQYIFLFVCHKREIQISNKEFSSFFPYFNVKAWKFKYSHINLMIQRIISSVSLPGGMSAQSGSLHSCFPQENHIFTSHKWSLLFLNSLPSTCWRLCSAHSILWVFHFNLCIIPLPYIIVFFIWQKWEETVWHLDWSRSQVCTVSWVTVPFSKVRVKYHYQTCIWDHFSCRIFKV